MFFHRFQVGKTNDYDDHLIFDLDLVRLFFFFLIFWNLNKNLKKNHTTNFVAIELKMKIKEK